MLLLLITIFHVTIAADNCRSLTGGNNGYITYGTSQRPDGSYESGTVAYLRCYTGYYPAGSTISWCYNGRWSPSGLGNCVWYNGVVSTTFPTTPAFTGGCPVAGTPTNGTIMYSNGMSFGPVPNGVTAQLKCHDGHNVEGIASMTCVNGRWNPDQFGACKTNMSYAQGCPDMTTPKNGVLRYSGSSTNGRRPPLSTVTVECVNQTVLYGTISSTCTSNGWYPPELGTCTAKTGAGCLEFPPIVGGDIRYFDYAGYSTATLQCRNGSVHGEVTSFCTNGQWNPPSLGTCNVTNSGSICPLFSVPEGAMITYSTNITNITLWTTATMKCLSGAAVVGTSYSTCLSTGWHPSQLGTCPNTTTGRECQRLPQRVGAGIIYTPTLWRENVSEGTNATLKCRDNEHVVGASFTRCTNKTWTPSELGVCSPATGLSCFSMMTPAGGHLEYSNGVTTGFIPHGGNVTLTCLTGRVVNGTGMSTCVSGTWYPQSVGECSNTPSLDTPKLCHPLNAPANGTVSLSKGSPDFPAENGVVAMLVCKPGSFVLGSTSSLCTGGTWIPSTLGTCNSNASSGGVETGCNWMFAPHGMFLNWSNINFGGPILNGTQLTANCVNSAPITGANNMTCVNGLWQPARFGTCGGSPGWAAGASCPPMAASSPDVGLIYRSGSRYMLGAVQDKLDHGTLLTVKCYNGTMRGNNVTTCADGKWYPSTIGGCFR
ncbi:hypothetical protein Y032_0011g1299 [Ancylostoma ceylanicum]|nr:hypothetical protein Y032_0011g1299 [Ancylostoma ceylanicum]